MVKLTEFPEESELVVGTVTKVEGFGAFVDLEQYPEKEGFIHISEVASGWVKYVRDYVRENQKVVCKVLSIDEGKGHVDLSLKQVNEHQRRESIAEWKNEQKAEKLLEMLADELDRSTEELLEDFGYDLVRTYGTLYGAFETAAIAEDALEEDGFEGDWVEAFLELARDNITIPFVKIKGYVDLQSFSPAGVDDVRQALEAAEETEFEDVEIEVQYMGAPHYRIQVQAPDYKAAEDELRAAAKRATEVIADQGGEGAFFRDLDDLKAKSGG